MTDPKASPDDVRLEISTNLDDESLNELLKRVARDVDRKTEPEDFEDEDHRRDFEAVLTAHRIINRHDRPLSDSSIGPSSKSFEGSVIRSVKGALRDLDPTDGEFSTQTVVRNDDRNARITGGD